MVHVSCGPVVGALSKKLADLSVEFHLLLSSLCYISIEQDDLDF